MGASTKRPGDAGTSRGMAPKEIASMQAQDTSQDIAQRLLAKAHGLLPGFGFVAAGMIVARSKSGNVRVGGWSGVSALWWRGDSDQLLIEHVEDMLDWSQLGYFASKYRREFEDAIGRSPVEIEGVGRARVRFPAWERDSRLREAVADA